MPRKYTPEEWRKQLDEIERRIAVELAKPEAARDRRMLRLSRGKRAMILRTKLVEPQP
jgi:hypothetical protein